MIRGASLLFIGTAALAILFTPAIAAAGVILNADNGSSERVVDANGSVPTDQLGLIWFPTLNPSTSVFGVTGSCKRASLESGKFTGNHKAKFSKVALLGFDSFTEIRLPNFKSKIKRGLPHQVQVVDITSRVRALAGSESLVLGVANVKFTGTVKAGDYIQCFFGVVEGDANLLPASASSRERQIFLEEIARETSYREFKPEFE